MENKEEAIVNVNCSSRSLMVREREVIRPRREIIEVFQMEKHE